MIKDLFTTLAVWNSDLMPFSLAFKRVRHSRIGHNDSRITKVQSHIFEKHPKNKPEWKFQVTLFKCEGCGLHFVSDGFTFGDGYEVIKEGETIGPISS
jgi:hypothetical protein